MTRALLSAGGVPMADITRSPAARTAERPRSRRWRSAPPLVWLLAAAAVSLGLWALILRGLATLF